MQSLKENRALDSVVISHKRETIEELRTFLLYMERSSRREMVKLSLNFQHKTFEDNVGFAVLKLSDRATNRDLVRKIKTLIGEEITAINNEIQRYERAE